MASLGYWVSALLFAAVSAGSYTTPEGMQVTWNVTTSTVSFGIYMPANLASDYDWWGIGFKTSGSRQDMIDSLLWMITKSGTFYDIWSTSNSDPPQVAQGKAQLLSHLNANGAYTTVITRNQAASGSSDMALTAGASYLLTYGYGPMSGSSLREHTRDGGATITLSNDYVAVDTSTTATTSIVLGMASVGLVCLALY